jgi:hypothetical protein
MIENGFKCIGSNNAIVENWASIVHYDSDEVDRRDSFDSNIPYDWSI